MVIKGGLDPIVGPGDVGNTNFVKTGLDVMSVVFGIPHAEIAGGVGHDSGAGAFSFVHSVGKPTQGSTVDPEGNMHPIPVVP